MGSDTQVFDRYTYANLATDTRRSNTYDSENS